MTKCILIFDEVENCLELLKILREKSILLSESLIISPLPTSLSPRERNVLSENQKNFKIINIENCRLLNPKLDRQIRQKSMRNWLMPFGFIAGLTFSNMTNLTTFSFLGLNNVGEIIFGGFLGMGSGYIGSIFASASININRPKEIRSLLNFNKEGKWLLILENQIGVEFPWPILKESKTKDIVFLEN